MTSETIEVQQSTLYSTVTVIEEPAYAITVNESNSPTVIQTETPSAARIVEVGMIPIPYNDDAEVFALAAL